MLAAPVYFWGSLSPRHERDDSLLGGRSTVCQVVCSGKASRLFQSDRWMQQSSETKENSVNCLGGSPGLPTTFFCAELKRQDRKWQLPIYSLRHRLAFQWKAWRWEQGSWRKHIQRVLEIRRNNRPELYTMLDMHRLLVWSPKLDLCGLILSQHCSFWKTLQKSKVFTLLFPLIGPSLLWSGNVILLLFI